MRKLFKRLFLLGSVLLMSLSHAVYDNGIAVYEAYRLNTSVDDDTIKDYYLRPYNINIIHAPVTFPVRYDADRSLGLIVTQSNVYKCSDPNNSDAVTAACNIDTSSLSKRDLFDGNFVSGGDKDLFIADGNNSVIVHNFASDTHGMGTHQLPSEYNLSGSLTAYDVDGDGITDVVLNNGSSNQLAISWNGGAQDWQTYVGASPSNRNYVPGAIQGSYATQGGVATYNIPFALPEGRGGFKPNLGISYNSDANNGIMGVGWNISGGSAITRCGLDIQRDGIIDGVDLDDNDKLCLNGVRMVLSSGTYGDNGAVYRLENNSIVRVKQLAADIDNSGSYFEVDYKNGSRDVFGRWAAHSKLVGRANTPIAWLIREKIESKAGIHGNRNVIKFTYDNTKNKNLTKVTYKGGGYIEYHYSDVVQPAETDAYVLGSKFPKRPLLSRVTIHNTNSANYVTEATGELYREYSFNYRLNATSKRYQLTQVSSCTQNNQCLKETEFDWHRDTASGFVANTEDLNIDMGANRGVKAIDINSDGKQELLVNNNDTDYIRIYDADGEEVYTIPKSNKNTQVHVVEFNGDGIPDILMSRGFDGKYRFDTVYIGTGEGSFELRRLTNYFQIQTGTAGDQLGDFNGDGLTDFYDYNLKRFYYNQSMTEGNDGFQWKLTSEAVMKDGSIRVVDINADGIDDIAFAGYPDNTLHADEVRLYL